MSQDEAAAKFLASVIDLWRRTPASEIAAMGSVTMVLEMGSSLVVKVAERADTAERASERSREQVSSRRLAGYFDPFA